MRDILVSTGDPDADAYLRIVRTILPMQRSLDDALAAIKAGRPEQSIPYGEPFPSYEDAAWVAICAEKDIEETWDKAHSHYTIATSKNPKAATLADDEAVAMFEEYNAR
ncbi:hypothetical protein ACFV0L_18935 [Streptosporangium canum]|uniref:hypothetical protein n=1 Tax=Streptosporangium canum TaxID=324952 RepID=UPI003694B2DD